MSNFTASRSGLLLVLVSLSMAAAAQPAEEIKFPELNSSYLRSGDFIGPDHVLRVRPGLDKDQVRLELGNPHFSEGLFAVREWDYAFNFYTGKGNEFTTCQYKVKFERGDGAYRVASTHWRNPECALLVSPPKVAAIADGPGSGAPQKIALGADGLFRFDGATEADLLPDGRKKVEALARDIRQNFGAVHNIVVTGHTDRLGTDSYNDTLSLERANVVRALLVSQGVEGARIRAIGMGKRQPVVTDCEGAQPTPSLVSCLQPNRRVEIEVTGGR